MKLIFLDIDGVLNNSEWYRTKAEYTYEYTRDIKAFNFDPDNWKWVEKLINDTDSKIVLSSSWRNYDVQNTINEFKYTGFDPITKYLIDVTPFSFERHRGKEIETFLKNTKLDVENYVIIDDDTDMLNEQLSHFVYTDYNVGMTEGDYLKAKSILNGKS